MVAWSSTPPSTNSSATAAKRTFSNEQLEIVTFWKPPIDSVPSLKPLQFPVKEQFVTRIFRHARGDVLLSSKQSSQLEKSQLATRAL